MFTVDFDFRAVFDPDDYMFFYKDLLSDERTEREISFLVDKLKLNRKHNILELACGHGRHSNGLAALGYKVTGYDMMPGFLKMAEKEALEKNLKVEYVLGDMRELKFEECFDRVNLLFTAFGYFVDDENQLVLENIWRSLKPNGLFCFDTHNRDMVMKNLKPYHVEEKEGNLMIDRMTFDSLTGRVYNSRVVIRNGKRKNKPFFVRYYNYTEMRELLGRVGFEIVESYGSFKGEPFESDSARIIYVARKLKRGKK